MQIANASLAGSGVLRQHGPARASSREPNAPAAESDASSRGPWEAMRRPF